MIKSLFIEFMRSKLNEKPNEYLFILGSVFQSLTKDPSSYSSQLKDDLQNLDLKDIDFSKKRGLAIRILGKIPKTHLTDKVYPKIPSIKSIQIKNFRSFGTLNSLDNGTYIDLNKNKNIIFAPNGGGKSSFCEAFEYQFTGSIKEVTRRKIAIKDYVKYKGKFKPEINIEFSDLNFSMNKEIQNILMHTFIEKNRLQEFALLGSKDTKTAEKDVIAILLGLEELDEFINKFVQYTSFKLQDFIKDDVNKQSNLVNDIIKKNIENKNLLRDQIAVLHVKRNIGKCKQKVKKYSSAIDILKVKNQKVESIQLEFHSFEEYEKYINDISLKFDEYKELDTILKSQQEQMQYKSLYELIVKLQDKIKQDDKCPVCDTPLDSAIKHPNEKAISELDLLKGLVKTQDDFQIIKNELAQLFEKLNAIERKVEINLKTNSTVYHDLTLNFIDNKKIDVKLIEQILNLFKTQNNDIKEYFKGIKALKLQVDTSESIIEKNKQIILKLNARINSENKTIKTIIESAKDYKKNEKDFINNKNRLAEINEKKKEEDDRNIFIQNVQKEYKSFRSDLNKFKLDIEQIKLGNIENDVKYFYNLINKHDGEHELVKTFQFIKDSQNYRIDITIGDNPEKLDAFIYLSEGHLRSLGLSIMLAIAKKMKLPFLIFDDVVNAIDSDHRANIIEMLSHDSTLRGIQQIITTHDRLFWERFCNSQDDVINSYVFEYTNRGTVVIEHNVGFREKIKKALEHYDIRQALIYCRIWLESEVMRYCDEKKSELTGRFTIDFKSNLLKPSLEKIYNEVIAPTFPNNTSLEIIKKDLINWSGQNQAHHSFDEHSYNFVHSKNSNEVEMIFFAIDSFVRDMFPEREKIRLIKESKKLIKSYKAAVKKLKNKNFCENAPSKIVLNTHKHKHQTKYAIFETIKSIRKIESLLVS